jgi:DNA-binding transcriptional LysR family regulator
MPQSGLLTRNSRIRGTAGGREVGLAPASFAEHAAKAGTGILLRDVVDPPIPAELSMLWPANDPSPAIASVLATARRCAERNGWLRHPLT